MKIFIYSVGLSWGLIFQWKGDYQAASLALLAVAIAAHIKD